MTDEELEQLRQSLHTSKQALASIFTRALSDEDGDVRDEATAALVRLGTSAVPALVEALQSPDGTVRIAAAVALGRIDGLGAWAPEVIPALLERLEDESAAVRAEAATALAHVVTGDGTTSPPELLLALNAATQDSSALVRRRAIGAISRIIDVASRRLDAGNN
jgi:HEAT repeat protein